MPELDGLEATRQLRQHAVLSATPIIAVTAQAMPGDRERCLAAGMQDYVTKPLSLEGLAERIAHHLAARVKTVTAPAGDTRPTVP